MITSVLTPTVVDRSSCAATSSESLANAHGGAGSIPTCTFALIPDNGAARRWNATTESMQMAGIAKEIARLRLQPLQRPRRRLQPQLHPPHPQLLLRYPPPPRRLRALSSCGSALDSRTTPSAIIRIAVDRISCAATLSASAVIVPAGAGSTPSSAYARIPDNGAGLKWNAITESMPRAGTAKEIVIRPLQLRRPPRHQQPPCQRRPALHLTRRRLLSSGCASVVPITRSAAIRTDVGRSSCA